MFSKAWPAAVLLALSACGDAAKSLSPPPPEVSPTLSSVQVAPASAIVADGTATATITVQVQDELGSPMAGQNLTIAVSGSDNTLVQPLAMTDALGMLTATVASTLAETKVVTVTVDTDAGPVALSQSPSATFIGDAANLSDTLSTASADPATDLVADGVALFTITTTVRDVNGNAVPGVAVTLAVDGTDNTLVQPGPTDADGVATGTLASTMAETKNVTATLDPAGAALVLPDVSVTFVGDADNVSPTLSTATLDNAIVVADGTQTTTVTVTIVDVHGNPLAGRSVALSVTGTGNVTTQPGPTLTDGTTTGTVASTVAEQKTITVTVDPGASQVVLTPSPSVTFIGDAGNISVTLSTVSANPAIGLVADGSTTSTLTVTVRDSNGNLVPGVAVTLVTDGFNNTLVQPGPTDVAGVATGTLASTTAETKHVTATLDPAGAALVLPDVSVTFVGDANNVSPTLSTATIDHAIVEADGTQTTTVTITLVDVNGNLLAGRTVELGVTGTGNVTTQPVPTQPDGTTTGTVASTVAEQKTVTVTVEPGVAPTVLQQTPVVDFVEDFLEPGDGMLCWASGSGGPLKKQIWDDSAGTWSALADVPTTVSSQWHVVTRRRPIGLGVEKLVATQGLATNTAFEMMRWNGLAWLQDFVIDELTTGNFIYQSFDCEYEALSGRAMFVYANNSSIPQYRVLDDGTWSAPAPVFATPPALGQVMWIELASRPASNEMALVYVDANKQLHAVIWDGTVWDEVGTKTTLSLAAGATWFVTKGFDAAYEPSTGDLVVAWGELHAGGGTRYVTRPAGGAWSLPANLNAPTVDVAEWVTLSPEPGGQRIAGSFYKSYLTGTKALGLATWDGSAWADAGQYDTVVHDALMLGRHASLAWVGASGVAVCVYADADSGALDWARWTAATGWAVLADVPIAGKNKTRVPLLYTVPGQDKVMAVFSDYNISMYAATYDGSAWTITNGGVALVTTGLASFHSQCFDISMR